MSPVQFVALALVIMMMQPARAVIRQYYVAVVEEEWDYIAGTTINPLTGEAYSDDDNVFLDASPQDRIGNKYMKAMYMEYTNATFTERKSRPSEEMHLGIMGPILRAEVGDELHITFKNMGQSGFSYSMHPHGVRYTKEHEGALYEANLPANQKMAGIVAPDQTHTYIWEATEDSGPAPGSKVSSIGWLYHSHGEHPIAEEYAGLVGAIIITAKGMADADGKPFDVDREFVTFFSVMDENSSVLFDNNLETYNIGNDVDTEDDDFVESNLMHAMNGLMYGAYQGGEIPFKMTKGELVRWHLMSLGTEVDLHSVHWHGNTLVDQSGIRTDVINLMPATMKTMDMVPMNVGIWLYHCHVNDHISAGMSTRYEVESCDECELKALPILASYSLASAAGRMGPVLFLLIVGSLLH